MFRKTAIIVFSKRFCHVYKKAYVPSSKIAEESIIFYDKGILALNKPYGIGFSQDPRRVEDPMEVSLNTLLPFVKEYLGCSNIFNVRVPEKYISGVAVFSTDEKIKIKLHNYLLRMRKLGIPSDTYLSVVLGMPLNKESHFEGAITLEKSPVSAKGKRSTLLSEYSKNQLKKGLAKKLVITHRTLAYNKKRSASLLEVASTINSWHSIRVYLATKLLSPVLGDNIYGSSVRNLLGERIVIDKFSPAAGLPQKLTPEIMQMLKLTSAQEYHIPLHLHLSNVTIDIGKDGVLNFSAPMPEKFRWTCQQLDLIPKTPEDEICIAC